MPDISPSLLGSNVPNPLPESVFGANLGWMHPAGRLIWATVMLIAGIAIIVAWIRIPKRSSEPSTWAQAMVGAVLVFALAILAYGTIPHEWLTFGDSYLKFAKDTYALQQDQWATNLPPFDVPRSALIEIAAGGMYIVFGTVNVLLFSAWQKRKVAESDVAEAAEGSALLGRLRRRAKRVSAYGRPVTTAE